MTIKEEIIQNIHETIQQNDYAEWFREPLVGFVSAQNPGYDQLTELVGHKHIHPTEILPNAKTVIVYFLPFKEEIGKKIQGEARIYQEWSDAYMITNALLEEITERLLTMLEGKGVTATGIPPTNSYNEETLTAEWSHKSTAVLAGIGSFGLNHLLVTKYGTTGRLCSIIVDANIPPSENTNHQYCLYYQTGKCKICLEKCPTGALSEHGIDRHRCNAYLDGKCVHLSQQGCPMCSSGPCAYRGF